MPDRAKATQGFSPGRRARLIALVLGGAVALSALGGCAAANSQPILPGTPVVKLLPSKAALDKLYGPEWERSVGPRSLKKSELTFTTKADPAQVGVRCAKALSDFYAAYVLRDGATVVYSDAQSNNAGFSVLRLATVAKATALVEKFGEITQACKNAPGDASFNTQPLKSSIPGAVGYGSPDGTAGKMYRFLAIADGDLVIMASSDISTAQADKEIQLELDTLEKAK